MTLYAGVIVTGEVDPEICDRLRGRMQFPGRSTRIWSDANVVIAEVAEGSVDDGTPVRFGRSVVVVDSRLTARDQLIRQLRQNGADIASTASDGELILRSYELWGEDCTTHLSGDFSFAVWDGERRVLFAARDRFGVRPFNYVRTPDAFFFSNDLRLLCDVKEFSSELNELAIADFLLFGYNLDRRQTFFAPIAKLPAAHHLLVAGGEPLLRRYWSLPLRDSPIRIGEHDAVEAFRLLFEAAVKERIGAGPVTISMSGGLDSTAIAATLVDLRRRGEVQCAILALTNVFDRLIPDKERHYSGIAATALEIEIEHQACDDEVPFSRWRQDHAVGIEPQDESMAAAGAAFFARAARHAPVLFAGHGGDSVFYTTHSHFYDLLRELRWVRFATEATAYAWTRRKRPPFGLRARVKRAMGVAAWQPEYPPWIQQEFESRYDLRARWTAFHAGEIDPPEHHPFRENAHEQLSSSFWQVLFERVSRSSTGCGVDLAAPYFDERIVEFLLSLPPMPHFADKDILRQSLKGRLPDIIRLRPKTPLQGDLSPWSRAYTKERIAIVQASEGVQKYVDRHILRNEMEQVRGGEHYVSQQNIAISLAAWISKRTDRT